MDSFEITITADWRYRDLKRGPQFICAGTYKVPEQMKVAVARMAQDAGVGVVKTPARKTRAPRNKSFRAAPSNKTTVE